MKHFIYIITTLVIVLFAQTAVFSSSKNTTLDQHESIVSTDSLLQMYQEMELSQVINFEVFSNAMEGHGKLPIPNKDIITLIDFSKPSSEKRMCVVHIKEKKVLYTSYVSHGKKSGDKYAKWFSNKVGSHKSSLGFYVTENTYNGRNGYSLVLNGLEKGFNSNAKQRAIVVHGADYCDPKELESSDRLGRSFGCPAIPQSLTRPIIDTIKEGTLLFVYANDQQYLKRSPILAR